MDKGLRMNRRRGYYTVPRGGGGWSASQHARRSPPNLRGYARWARNARTTPASCGHAKWCLLEGRSPWPRSALPTWGTFVLLYTVHEGNRLYDLLCCALWTPLSARLSGKPPICEQHKWREMTAALTARDVRRRAAGLRPPHLFFKNFSGSIDFE